MSLMKKHPAVTPIPAIDKNRKALEDSFFVEKDRALIEKLRALKAMKETKEALARVSGITNEAVLQKLVELEVRPETLASLAVVPLVEVAWADGQIDAKEKEAVLAAVEKAGMGRGSVDYELVEQWLSHKPPARLLEAWTHYVEGLCSALSAAELAALSHELIGHSRAVAEASGGFLGLGSRVSEKEAHMLSRLEAAFRKG